MQSKSMRGVQQEDVWAAADALIAAGLRPTIERVRQKLGRGSPNTVAPMLEYWFASLGQRLRLAEAKPEEGGIPAPLRSAMMELWSAALLVSRKTCMEELAARQAEVDTERVRLSGHASVLSALEERLQERQNSIDQALSMAQEQVSDVTARLAQATEKLERHDEDMSDLRTQLASKQKELDAARELMHKKSEEFEKERRKLEERGVSNERRLLEEVDRARQEAKQVKSAFESLERRNETLGTEFTACKKNADNRFQADQQELASLREQLATASARTDELRRVLGNQTMQLSQLAPPSKGSRPQKVANRPRRQAGLKPSR